MIKKLVMLLNNDKSGYWFIDKARTSSNKLEYLPLAFSKYWNDFNVWINEIEKNNEVFIWSRDSIKKMADLEFATDTEEDDFEEAYDEYYSKRWDEMPKLRLTIQDWNDLQERWKQIKKEQPKYLIFELDDSGEFDKVRIVGKDELSEQDREYIKTEHEKYLKYQRARDKYLENHPDYSEVWRGPQDDEYEADIMKYYEE